MLLAEDFSEVTQSRSVDLHEDIWREIFLQCIDEPSESTYMGIPPVLLIICQVCSSWRVLATFAPELWARQTITLGKGITGLVPRREWLDLAFHRARGYPLDLHLSGGIEAPSPPIYQQTNISSLIGPMLSRIRKLNLNPTDFFTREDLAKLPESGAHQLEELTLTGPSCGYSHRPNPLCSRIWANSHRLRRLSIYHRLDCDFEWLNVGLMIPFHQLTHIHIDSLISAAQCLAVLRASQDLRSFEIYRLSRLVPSEKPCREPVTVLNLEHLYLQADANRSMGPSSKSLLDLLSLIEAPSLSHLHLNGLDTSEFGFQDASIYKSARRLKVLKLAVEYLFPEDILALLEEHGTHLEVLELKLSSSRDVWCYSSAGAMNEVIKRLDVWDEDSQAFALCPNLKQFAINSNSLNHARQEQGMPRFTPFVDMIEHRWSKGRLRRVTVYDCDPSSTPPQDLTRLMDLKNEGMSGIFISDTRD